LNKSLKSAEFENDKKRSERTTTHTHLTPPTKAHLLNDSEKASHDYDEMQELQTNHMNE
jgi:hypothetical protein